MGDDGGRGGVSKIIQICLTSLMDDHTPIVYNRKIQGKSTFKRRKQRFCDVILG